MDSEAPDVAFSFPNANFLSAFADEISRRLAFNANRSRL